LYGVFKLLTVEIVPNDSKQVAKAIIVDEEGRVLMLKRSNYTKKYSGEWDLPGGHIYVGEEIQTGLKREVKEETDLDIKDFKFIEKNENLSFFLCKYTERPIKLSLEHTCFRFFPKDKIDSNTKFGRVSIKALERNND
tara:strand:+ start:451 stop:864 length:414 start_codon:yes stop_codon:yes gene_type:complete